MIMKMLAALGLGALLAGAPAARAEPVTKSRAGQATEFSSQNQKAKTKNVRTRTASRTRITVRRRSFLDAGTEVLPGERKFNDYAVFPFTSPLSVLGPGKDYSRSPLNGPFDVPGDYNRW
jgi:hypothetical protein